MKSVTAGVVELESTVVETVVAFVASGRLVEAGLFKEKYQRNLDFGYGNLWVDAR